MNISIYDIFKIGVGPSSSHTVGPMRAARQFLLDLRERGLLQNVTRVQTQLYGSLALTGKGHGTDRAILLGLSGETPDGVDPDTIEDTLARIRAARRIKLLSEREIDFDEDADVLLHRDQVLPKHSNGLHFTARDEGGQVLLAEEFYSIGGGFIIRGDADEGDAAGDSAAVPYPFESADELLSRARENGLAIHELMLANETAWRPEDETRSHLLQIWQVMQDCVERGTREDGMLPGGLNVRRRAPKLCRDLKSQAKAGDLDVMDWVNLFAMAVNEENAAGGRVVTAPTNGAAGIIPAVLHYYVRFADGADDAGVLRFLLTAGAIGILYKKNASISGAEMGCQGEVGVACSMAAGGLVAALGGNNETVENAAEIGMEHNLGLTCDPVGGLVQIPCIERNAMGSWKAINAARLAMRGDGQHRVTLDQVINTMRQTGRDMQSIYKETSQGGLAVNVTEC
ncbi:MAG TPA: L-serine ammonia-lyase [Gammaproteobacteria bacterium]|nr:L-serine ammonia-lyase [Gammaproteobacteria bacterium]HET7586771.1 L-serine ammonia-lyase [Gammaproteobacteria bacterium]